MKFKSVLKATALAASMALGATAAIAADIIVIGGKPDDPFWNKIKKGIDDVRPGVEANGGTVEYLRMQTYDNFASEAAEIIRVAISKNPDGIAVPNWVYDSQDAPIKEAIAAGIEVILFNAGTGEKAAELGAINYIGTDEYIAGRGAGDYLVAQGVTNAVCLNSLPGVVNVEARCEGMIDAMTEAGAKAEQLPLPTTVMGDQAAIAEAVKAHVTQNPDLDGGIAAVGVADAAAMQIGLAQAGRGDSFTWGSFDFDETVLGNIKAGDQGFAVDQLPYMQATLSVILLSGHLHFGATLPTSPILTGPGIIDASNVDATIEGVKAGAR